MMVASQTGHVGPDPAVESKGAPGSFMNIFMLCSGTLYLGATAWEMLWGSRLMAGIYLCYALSAYLLAFVKVQ